MKKKLLKSVLACGAMFFSLIGMAESSFITNPTSSVLYSDNSLILSKELYGYRNYGVVDHASDVLYSGEAGFWTFDLSQYEIYLADYDTARITISLVLDDHYTVPTADYSLVIDLLGVNSFSGPTDSLGLVHGTPYGRTFNDWTSVSFDTSLLPLLSDSFVVSIENTSSIPVKHWVAIDNIELELTGAAPVPEPTTFLLFGAGLIVLRISKRITKK